jgi:hypothetical protein
MARPAMSVTTRVEDLRSIDIAWIRRKGGRNVGYSGTIRWSCNGTETASIAYDVEHAGIRVRYRHKPYGGAPQVISELLPVVTSPMRFGGCRHWFVCLACWRRCRILFAGVRFRCRICYEAKYESQYQHPALTACDRRWWIRRHLEDRGGEKWPFGLDDGFPPKPPRMHWRTYRRLKHLDSELAARWRIGMAGFLERLEHRLANGKPSGRT